MATGKLAFDGRSRASVIAAVLERDPPPVSSVRPVAPPSLDRLVRLCLAKEPDERWQSARDLKAELEWLAEGAGQIAPAPAKKRPLLLAVSLLGLALAVGTFVGRFLFSSRASVATANTHMSIPLPTGIEGPSSDGLDFAISPDSTRVVHTGFARGDFVLFDHPFSGFTSNEIPGTDGAYLPFFSPDGAWVGFVAHHKLQKVSLHGGTPIELTDARYGGAYWAEDGTIVFVNRQGDLSEIDASGGSPRVIRRADPVHGEFDLQWPQLLNRGREILYGIHHGGSPESDQVVVETLGTRRRHVLLNGVAFARYVRTGHLLFTRGETLFAAPMSLSTFEITGSAVPVVDSITASRTIDGSSLFNVSASGVLAYSQSVPHQRVLLAGDRGGVLTPLPLPAHNYVDRFALSPDGKKLALVAEEGGRQAAYIYDLERTSLALLTTDGGVGENLLAWSPDSKRVTYSASKNGAPLSLYWRLADCSAPEERLSVAAPNVGHLPIAWTPDGKTLLFRSRTRANGLWALTLGERRPHLFLQDGLGEQLVSFSPDGRWIAYTSLEARNEPFVYVRPFPSLQGRWRVSRQSGYLPQWGRNGREIDYISADENRWMAVPFEGTPAVHLGQATELLRLRPDSYVAISADGKRVYVNEPTEAHRTQINIVFNWFDEMKNRIAGAKSTAEAAP
jgi:Tol biopolymer transport system component